MSKVEHISTGQNKTIKKINIGEYFKNCFKFTVNLKQNNYKICSTDQKIFDKNQKSDRLPSNHINKLCDLLKNKQLFYSKKRKIILPESCSNTITTTTKRSSTIFDIMKNKTTNQKQMKDLSKKSIYSYKVLKIMNTTDNTTKIMDNNDYISSCNENLQKNDENEKLIFDIYNNLNASNKEINDFTKIHDSTLYSSLNKKKPTLKLNITNTKFDNSEKIKIESLTHFDNSGCKSERELFREANNILTRINLIDSRRNKILNEIMSKNRASIIKGKKSKVF